MKTDGVFTIQSGQGISQGIVQELGLSADQAKKIDKTTWNSIFKEIEKQKQTDEKLYAGGSNLDGKTSQNFVVQPGQTVKISLKDTWGNILNIVNNHLGTNFEVEENKINQPELTESTEEPLETIIKDSDGQITERLMQLREYVVTKQHEIADKAGDGEWSKELIDEYNSLVPYVREELSKLVGNPTQVGQMMIITDNESNATFKLKAMRSTSEASREITWSF